VTWPGGDSPPERLVGADTFAVAGDSDTFVTAFGNVVAAVIDSRPLVA